jgi:hypothetical protein
MRFSTVFILCCLLTLNALSPEFNPICYLLALLAHDFLHVSRISVNYEPCKYLNIFLLLFWNALHVYICTLYINMNIKTPNVLAQLKLRLHVVHFFITFLLVSWLFLVFLTVIVQSSAICSYCYCYDAFKGLLLLTYGTDWLSIVSVRRELSSCLTPCRSVPFEGRHSTVIRSH